MRTLLAFTVLSLVFGCTPTDKPIQKLEGLAQGTTYHISYWHEQSLDDKALEAGVVEEFAAIDKTLSNYRPDSVIEQFNQSPSTDSQDVGEEIVALVRLARGVSELSQGCFDLTIKPLFDLWGFQGESLTIPDPIALQRALATVGMDKVELVDELHLRKPNGVRVDVSSVAQGYSVEKISRVLERFGVHHYLVEIGGELKTQGHKPNGQGWRIAVEKPLPGEQRLHKVIALPKDQASAVMTSGTYRHYFDVDGQRYSHILDARDGKPVRHNLVAVTVIHEDPTLADAWSTALLCVGEQQGMQLANNQNLKVLFIQQQGNDFVETQSQALLSSGLSID
jgi:thiamine biosynthesis lipoprotein